MPSIDGMQPAGLTRDVAGVVVVMMMIGFRGTCVGRLYPVKLVGTVACRKRVQPDRIVLEVRMLHEGGTPNSCGQQVRWCETGYAY
jgi:hypothetical protein